MSDWKHVSPRTKKIPHRTFNTMMDVARVFKQYEQKGFPQAGGAAGIGESAIVLIGAAIEVGFYQAVLRINPAPDSSGPIDASDLGEESIDVIAMDLAQMGAASSADPRPLTGGSFDGPTLAGIDKTTGLPVVTIKSFVQAIRISGDGLQLQVAYLGSPGENDWVDAVDAGDCDES